MALPMPLNNVLVQQGNGQVYLSWDYQAGAVSYSIERTQDLSSWTPLASPTVPEFLDTTVTTGEAYYYRVAGVNADGTGPYSSPQQVTVTQSGSMSLGQLRLLSQQKADRVGSEFVTKGEWNTYINQSYFELYDILVQKYGDDYFVEQFEFTLTNSNRYPLPDGINYNGIRPFYKLMGVDINIAGQDAWMTLRKYMFIQRNKYVYPQITTNVLGISGLRYRMVGGDLTFIPTPSAGQRVRVFYIPRLRTLLKDTDLVDGVSGWTEYIAIDAAIKALVKEESDVSALQFAKQQMLERIEAAAENRDAGEPEVISRTRNMGVWGWSDDGGENGGPIGGI
jgi:fibronectin type 3 domain-containing protein